MSMTVHPTIALFRIAQTLAFGPYRSMKTLLIPEGCLRQRACLEGAHERRHAICVQLRQCWVGVEDAFTNVEHCDLAALRNLAYLLDTINQVMAACPQKVQRLLIVPSLGVSRHALCCDRLKGSLHLRLKLNPKPSLQRKVRKEKTEPKIRLLSQK